MKISCRLRTEITELSHGILKRGGYQKATASASGTPSAAPSPSKVLTPTPIPKPTRSEKQIVVVEGQQFSIALRSNPTTPYHWELTFDTGVIALKNQTYVSDPQPSTPVPGRGGTEVFTFQALRVGTTNIAFHHIQSWGSSAVITTSAAKTTSAEDSSYTVTVH